jgi:thiol-disulfide isomerase/thioredoxin
MTIRTSARSRPRRSASSVLEMLRMRWRSDSATTQIRSSARRQPLSPGQLGLTRLTNTLADRLEHEPDADVRHRIELAINQLGAGPRSAELADAYAAIDERSFGQVEVGRSAVDFELTDTNGDPWRLSTALGRGPVVLIWVFADWCPVCHHEFRDLIDLRAEFESRGIAVATIECHDRFRCRVMTGQERPPSYRGGNLAAVQPQAGYRDRIWWPHLSDPAAAVGAIYGADPLEFVVQAECNRAEMKRNRHAQLSMQLFSPRPVCADRLRATG